VNIGMIRMRLMNWWYSSWLCGDRFYLVDVCDEIYI